MFHPQTYSQSEGKNNIIKAYFRTFVNQKQGNQAKLLLIAKFVYNNTQNVYNGYKSFKLNYKYHLCIFYKNNFNYCFRSKSVD